MKILITGGGGFIASNIADRYLELGHSRFFKRQLQITGEKWLSAGFIGIFFSKAVKCHLNLK